MPDLEARAIDALRYLSDEGRNVMTALIAVDGHLDTPYEDDPRWTPWSRFVLPALTRLDTARTHARNLIREAREREALAVALDVYDSPEDRPLRPAEWARAFRRMSALEEMGLSIPTGNHWAPSDDYDAEGHARLLLEDDVVRAWNRDVCDGHKGDHAQRTFEKLLNDTKEEDRGQ